MVTIIITLVARTASETSMKFTFSAVCKCSCYCYERELRFPIILSLISPIHIAIHWYAMFVFYCIHASRQKRINDSILIKNSSHMVWLERKLVPQNLHRINVRSIKNQQTQLLNREEGRSHGSRLSSFVHSLYFTNSTCPYEMTDNLKTSHTKRSNFTFPAIRVLRSLFARFEPNLLASRRCRWRVWAANKRSLVQEWGLYMVYGETTWSLSANGTRCLPSWG